MPDHADLDDPISLSDVDPADPIPLSDDELAELAMSAAPFDPFDPGTVPFEGTTDDQAVALLPSWYMPAPSLRRDRPRVMVFAGLAIALLTVNVGGFCVTYGFPEFVWH